MVRIERFSFFGFSSRCWWERGNGMVVSLVGYICNFSCKRQANSEVACGFGEVGALGWRGVMVGTRAGYSSWSICQFRTLRLNSR